jgi:hypothetical protein
MEAGCKLQFLNNLQGLNVDMILEITDEFVWGQITVGESCNVLKGDHYFAPDCDVKLTENYLNF